MTHAEAERLVAVGAARWVDGALVYTKLPPPLTHADGTSEEASGPVVIRWPKVQLASEATLQLAAEVVRARETSSNMSAGIERLALEIIGGT